MTNTDEQDKARRIRFLANSLRSLARMAGAPTSAGPLNEAADALENTEAGKAAEAYVAGVNDALRAVYLYSETTNKGHPEEERYTIDASTLRGRGIALGGDPAVIFKGWGKS